MTDQARQMRTSRRYALLGALAGLLAPSALFLFAASSKREIDPFWLSVLLAAGGMTVFALLGRMIGLRDERLEELSDTDALTGRQTGDSSSAAWIWSCLEPSATRSRARSS